MLAITAGCARRSLVRPCLKFLLVVSITIGGSNPLRAEKSRWIPVSPADLNATSSQSAPGSDIEILFNHQKVDSDMYKTWVEHHIQAKIYSDAGVERSAIFAIEYNKEYRIWDVAARVVKPDGTSTELGKADLKESTAIKGRGWEVKRTAFAFPKLQPGDVVEYRWDQSVPDSYFNYLTTYCQHPGGSTREYTFEVTSTRQDFNLSWYNCQSVEQNPKSRKITIRNLPPFIEEPLMPPEKEFRSWILLVFSHPYLRFYDNNGAWNMIGEYLAEEFRLSTKPSTALKAKAAQLVAGAQSPEERLARLYDFCQTEITNLDWADKAKVVDAKKKRDNEDSDQSPEKTLDRKTGYPRDIELLFGALARAVGFEARLALNADHEDVLNINTPRGWILANRRSVAVKVGEHWRFYVPGQYLIPAGLLGPKDQGAPAFVCDEKKCWFDTMQIPAADNTEVHRTGHFIVDAEGTLDGTVEVQFTGERAANLKQSWWEYSTEEIVGKIRDGVVERLSAAEVTDVSFENVQNRTMPVIFRYHVRVPGYAEQLGSRLALPLNYFHTGLHETFSSDVRRYPVFFEFPEHEHEELDIVLPEGFALDAPSSPAPVGQPSDPIRAQYTLKYLGKSRKLIYVRDHVLGQGGAIAFRAESYAPIRKILGDVYKSDTHQLVLKPKADAIPTTPAAAAAPSSATPSS